MASDALQGLSRQDRKPSVLFWRPSSALPSSGTSEANGVRVTFRVSWRYQFRLGGGCALASVAVFFAERTNQFWSPVLVPAQIGCGDYSADHFLMLVAGS